MKIAEIVSETTIQAGGAPPGPAPGGVVGTSTSDAPYSPLGHNEELPIGEIQNRKTMRDRDKSLFTKNTVNIVDVDDEDKEKSKKKGRIKHIYSPSPLPGMTV